MNNKNTALRVCKSNQVVEAGYRLELNEQRVILACIAQVKSKEALLATDRFELSAKDFADIFSVSIDRAYHTLKDVSESIFNRYIVIDKPFPDRPKITRLKTRWISSIYYMDDEGKIALTFAQDMLPFLSQLNGRFTQYELKNIANMKSIYAIRLYELILQWKGTKTRTVEVDWLKKQFELGDGYSAMCDLKKRVIDPATKDINQHSDYTVSWTQQKTGRKVTHLIFTFSEKKSPEDEAAKPKKSATPQEKMILGVPISKIMQESRVGESYEDAAARINHEKATKKPSPQKQKTAVPVSDLIAKTGLNKSLTSSPVVSPSADSEAHRISVINFFINKNGKEKYLTEFKEKGFVSIHGIGGAIIEADLKLAGLFD